MNGYFARNATNGSTLNVLVSKLPRRKDTLVGVMWKHSVDPKCLQLNLSIARLFLCIIFTGFFNRSYRLECPSQIFRD